MVKRKGTPKKNPRAKSTTQTRIFLMNNKHFKVRLTTLKEIKRLQMSTTLCIPKLPFSRLMREIMFEQSAGVSYKIQSSALEAMQEAAEIYLVQLLEDANRCSAHARRVTLKPVDVALTLMIRGNRDPGYNIF